MDIEKNLKKITIFLLVFLATCGPSEEEIQSRINESVQSALSDPTSTTVKVTTTTLQEQPPPDQEDALQEQPPPDQEEVVYSEAYDEGFYYLHNAAEYQINNEKLYLKFRATWKEVNLILVHFKDMDKICTNLRDLNVPTAFSLAYISIQINQDVTNCIESSEILAIEIIGTNGYNTLTFYKDGTFTNFSFDEKVLEGKSDSTCCHNINFELLNQIFKESKSIYKNSSSSSSQTTTTTTSTTTTVPKYIFPTVEFPGCPDSYSMTNSIMNLSIDYTITAGDAEVVEFTFENFDTNNGEDFSNKNIFSSEEAAESGIILPKTKGEVIGVQTTFIATNQNEKRILKLVVTATDSNGFTGSGECEFVMNPNGEIGQATTTTTTTTTIQQNEESNNVGGIPGGLFEISYLNKGFGWNNNNLYTYPNNNQNSKPVALEFLEGNEDNCDSINFLWSNGNHLVLDTIIGTKPLENCSRFILSATQGVNFTILYMEEFVKWNDPSVNDFEKLCGDFQLQYIEIQYFGNKYLTYYRNGELKYFENSYTLSGQGTHNLDLSLLDIRVLDGGANYGYGDC